MSRKLLLLAASVALFSGSVTFANAADIIDPPVVELPEPMTHVANNGGWYLRGDVGYSVNHMSDVEYITAGGGLVGKGLLRGKLDNSFTGGIGIGYDSGKFFRTDVTLEYFGNQNYLGSSTGTCTSLVAPFPQVSCTTVDKAKYDAHSFMANFHFDIVKNNGVTPYVGFGVGGTHVKWGALTNDFNNALVVNADEVHEGASNWRFTYALMAGASFDVSDCVALDAGYRYRNIEGGKMFGIGPAGTTGPAYDKGIVSHDFRIGARYKLGHHGGGGCGGAKVVDYQPDYQPVYK